MLRLDFAMLTSMVQSWQAFCVKRGLLRLSQERHLLRCIDMMVANWKEVLSPLVVQKYARIMLAKRDC